MFAVGDRVIFKNTKDRGVIKGIAPSIGKIKMYEVEVNGSTKRRPENTMELALEALSPEDLFSEGRFDDFSAFRRHLTHIRIKGGLTNIVYSMKYGDVQFLPYQFKPVFKFIESNTGRLLIADEVGLGKTIEALYIWKELQARSDAIRLLIIAPAVLRTKWRNDMVQHFGMDDARIVDASELLVECRQARRNRHKSFCLITSLQAIRCKDEDVDDADVQNCSPKIQLSKYIEQVAVEDDSEKIFDLIIIDEAHYLAKSDTANFQTGARFNQVAENLVMLSATPVSNSSEDLYNLLRILAPSEYQSKRIFDTVYEENKYVVQLANLLHSKPVDIPGAKELALKTISLIQGSNLFRSDVLFQRIKDNLDSIFDDDEKRIKTYMQVSERFFYNSYFTRSRKKDVMKKAIRSANTVSFKLTDSEEQIYNTCTYELVKKSEERNERLYSFSIMARQRELASCIPAALRRWRFLKKNEPEIWDEEEEELFDLLNMDDRDIPYSCDRPSTVPEFCYSITNDQLDEIERNDSKYKSFYEVITEKIKEKKRNGKSSKVVVFSFFRSTLEYLERRLTEDGIGNILIMGGLEPREKDNRLCRFKDDSQIDVLLSSEVGAEGLDMQFASIEVNYDLPWNPMRLEQRIGRIDRIGQKEDKIHIINMICRSTVEDRVLEILYDKIQIFKNSIGDLDEILGKLTRELGYSLLNSELTSEQKLQLAANESNRFVQEMAQLQQLEESAGLSQAFSDSIIEYVGNSERNNRYVRGEDLINYIDDFFVKMGNGTRFYQEKGNSMVWNLEMSDKDYLNYKSFLTSNGFDGKNTIKQTTRCLFPQGKTMNYRGESIDINNTLIKWIHAKTTENFADIAGSMGCYCLEIPRKVLDDEYLDKQSYVFILNQFKCDGVKQKNELMFHICSPEDLVVHDGKRSEYLVAQSIFYGSKILELDKKIDDMGWDAICEALSLCSDASMFNVNEIYDEEVANNEAIYLRQKAKTDSFYAYHISKLESLIAKMEQEGKNRGVKLNKAKLESLKYRYEADLDELESKKDVIPEIEPIATGIIFIRD